MTVLVHVDCLIGPINKANIAEGVDSKDGPRLLRGGLMIPPLKPSDFLTPSDLVVETWLGSILEHAGPLRCSGPLVLK